MHSFRYALHWCKTRQPFVKPSGRWCKPWKPFVKPSARWCKPWKPFVKPSARWCTIRRSAWRKLRYSVIPSSTSDEFGLRILGMRIGQNYPEWNMCVQNAPAKLNPPAWCGPLQLWRLIPESCSQWQGAVSKTNTGKILNVGVSTRWPSNNFNHYSGVFRLFLSTNAMSISADCVHWSSHVFF